ncbi:WD40 repeat domain-containing protein [Edaphobacter aggregans]|uniref:WD40 repeat domain-containing protein n=1 Tax=Edaphobacter aggregans TaxID=570835 RepID=UPI000554533B|nr:WD40 repeat domain-containing protein [Edaphobacter aggregans]
MCGLLQAIAVGAPLQHDPTAPPSNPAYVDYLIAENMAGDGSRAEALHKLAQSLRLQPAGNPAAGLAFQLLTEQRTNSRLILHGHTDAVLFAAYSPDGTKILTTSADGTARLWDARTGQMLVPPMHHEDSVLAAGFSSDGKRIVTGSEDKTARIWETATGKPIGAPLQMNGEVLTVSFSPDGSIVATGADNGIARTWNGSTGAPLSPPIVYHEAVYSVRFSPDGSQLLTATGDNIADLLDPKTGTRVLKKPIRQNNIIFTAVFSPDGTQVLTASADHTARIWNAKTGAAIGNAFHHGFSSDAASFSQDGSRVLTVSWDHTARVWDARTGQALTPPLQHADAVLKGALSPNGSLAATVGRDHSAYLWDATTGEELRLPLRARNSLSSIAFSPDGESLLVAVDSTVQVIDLPPLTPVPAWVADLADFASTQVKYNQDSAPDLSRIRQLRQDLLASSSTDLWTRFGRWYFTESDQRAISPWSHISLQEYVNGLIEQGDNESLELAATLAYDHPTWMKKIVQIRVHQQAETQPGISHSPSF